MKKKKKNSYVLFLKPFMGTDLLSLSLFIVLLHYFFGNTEFILCYVRESMMEVEFGCER